MGRIGFDYFSTRKVSGELFSGKVAFGSGEKEGSRSCRRVLQLQAAPVQWLVLRIEGVDANPSYHIVGGLVLVPFSFPWLSQRPYEDNNPKKDKNIKHNKTIKSKAVHSSADFEVSLGSVFGAAKYTASSWLSQDEASLHGWYWMFLVVSLC